MEIMPYRPCTKIMALPLSWIFEKTVGFQPSLQCIMIEQAGRCPVQKNSCNGRPAAFLCNIQRCGTFHGLGLQTRLVGQEQLRYGCATIMSRVMERCQTISFL